MSKLQQGLGCWNFPSGAINVRKLDMGSVTIKFTPGVTVRPGGSIVARFRDDGSVYIVCLEEPSALFGKIEIVLPTTDYEICPPELNVEITVPEPPK